MKSALLRVACFVGGWAALLFALASLVAAESRRADDVFHKWLTWQHVHADLDLRKNRDAIDRNFVQSLARKTPADLRARLGFLGLDALSGKGDSTETTDAALRKVRAWIGELESDPRAFAAKLTTPEFSNAGVDRIEEEAGTSETSEQYRVFLENLLGYYSEEQSDRALLAAANRMFEYAFAPRTFPDFLRTLNEPERRPAARFFYSNMWYHLSGTGWRYWHAAALEQLRQAAQSGREVVYIAGGTDLYHPIREGVYNIRIIDPIFPTQTKYYSEGWEYLIRSQAKDGGIGDEINFDTPRGRLVLRRIAYSEAGVFATGELEDGESYELPRSETVWAIFDSRGERLGQYTLERRFVTQADFKTRSDRTFLISFNELSYIVDEDRGWGIDPRKFDDDIIMHVKQLRRPLDKAVMTNMARAADSPFSFIRLGSSVD